LIVAAAWIVGARMIAFGTAGNRTLALAGTLLVVPWAIIALLWVGIGAPFQATPSENQTRYLVLLASAVVAMSAFVALRDVLREAEERFYSAIGFAAGIAAGAAYLVCISMSVASTIAETPTKTESIVGWLRAFYSVLEFVACVSTYVATAAFAASL